MSLNSNFSARVAGRLQGARVLVTGATGFTGSVVVKMLVEEGAEVRAIARDSSDLRPFKGLDVQWLRGEVYDPQLIEKAVEGVDYIFHIAAAFRQAKVEDQEYHRVHVESTKLLAHAATLNRNFKRFVHVSTMGVHGHIENPPGNENSPYAPGDIYQRTKLEAETWIRDFAKQEALPLVVIRPTAIYGPGDKRLLKIFKMATWPAFPILGFGKCLYHLIHVNDLSKAIILSGLEQSALNQVFLIGNVEAIRLEDIAKTVAKEYRHKLNIFRVPVTPFFIAADLCELICKPFGIEPPLYRRRVAFYTKDRSFDTSRMQKILGFTPELSNEQGIIETAQWYLQHGWIKVSGAGKNTETPDAEAATEETLKRQVNS